MENLLNEYKLLEISQQLDYEKFYLYSIVTHSTAIEGSTITEIENQLLFDKKIAVQKPITELLMNFDLKNAYDKAFEFADKHIDISIKLLCLLSALVMKNTGSIYKNIMGEFSSANGDLRLLNVSAGRGGQNYLAWQKISQRLQQFCDFVNNVRKTTNISNVNEIYKLSFLAHYELASIHPWADGNGRMARLVMNMLQKEFGVILSVVKKENRLEYIQSLSDSQAEDNSKKFIEFMFKHHKENIQQQINEYKISMEK